MKMTEREHKIVDEVLCQMVKKGVITQYRIRVTPSIAEITVVPVKPVEHIQVNVVL